ncbi:Wzz/FepE/Etk N-terminal domain-containing protein [Streptomyces sp. NPDC015492]|uniref:Wzz/FepE/Etk N-terminal domain-containing protein n=1 Tax=Streptomyces sp. NPDC015492 TaxID=3364958 RepID=UPI0036FCFBD3
MTTRTASEPTGPAPLLDLQVLVVAVRRRRRLWSSVALVGMLLGGASAVLLPPPPTATTKLLVAHQEDQPNDPGTLIQTDAALLRTTRIADAALRTLGSREKSEDFMEDYEAVGLTNNLLRIDVAGASGAEAVARAQALADAFVADHVRRIREAADAEAKALLDQRDRLRKDLAEVDRTIGEGSQDEGPKVSADRETLFARRAELTSQISDYGRRAAEARIGTPRLVSGTQVVDAPRLVRHSLPTTAATNAGIGLALGLALGLGVAAVGAVVADRPVLRREIAAHLGASVIAELPGRSPRWWRRRRVRATRTRLASSVSRTVRGSAEPVSLLELGSARATAGIARDLAGELAADGPVAVLDGLPGRPLAGRGRKQEDLTVVDAGDASSVPHQQRRLGIGSVAPGTAWGDLQHLGTRTVLVVRAGHGSAAWLHTVARHLADQRISVIGVVLIDPDPGDRTDGTLWDGPSAAPRDEGDPPARRNGTGRRRTDRLPMWAARVADDDQEGR